MFKDRDQAATELAARLAHLRGQRPLILAVPRGAVPMGVILATALEGDLDLILVGTRQSRVRHRCGRRGWACLCQPGCCR